MGILKNGCGQSGHGTKKCIIYLKNEQIEKTDFLHAGANLI